MTVYNDTASPGGDPGLRSLQWESWIAQLNMVGCPPSFLVAHLDKDDDIDLADLLKFSAGNHDKENPMRSISAAATCLSCVLAASTLFAASPNTFLFEVSNVITPDQPSATVTLWAAFEPSLYAFAKSSLAVHATTDPGGFSDPAGLMNKYSDPGEVSPDGDSVTDMFLIQMHALGGLFADTSNPIPVWTATWTTGDFTPRGVALLTDSDSFFLYIHEDGRWDDYRDIDFAEGSGLIAVVPAPAGALVLAGAAWSATRRCRHGSTRTT